MLKCKKTVAFWLAAMLVFSVFPVSVLANTKTDYAEVVLGYNVQTKNAEAVSYRLLPTLKDGVVGAKTRQANNIHYLQVNISDDFMYDLPNDTPVDITVEYYDDSEGSFCLTYDSYNPIESWNNIANNQVTNETEEHYLTNTGEWKTHTFHLEDFRAANRQDGFYDFRVSCWNPRSGFSTKDVLFKSVKIEYGQHATPLKIGKIDMGQLGHLMSSEQEKIMSIPITNRLDEKLIVDWNVKILDNYERVVGEVTHHSELEGKEAKTEEVKLDITEKGIYSVKCEAIMYAQSEPEKKFNGEVETVFSVQYVYNAENADTTLGYNHQVVHGGFGDPEGAATAITRGGGTLSRDVLTHGFTKQGPGKYVLNDAGKRWIKEIEMGVDFLFIFMREPGSGVADNVVPRTDAEVAEWASYVRCVAEALGDKGKYYEIWNEYNFQGFNTNGGTPEEYVRLLKAAYTAIKEVNPNAVVIGLDTAPPEGTDSIIDYDWSKAVLDAGAYNYMDAVSIHPYDHVGGMFREHKYLEEVLLMRELISQYGEPLPMWSTEVGFMTIEEEGHYTQTEQSRGMVLTRAITKAYDLFEKEILYCLCDRTRRDYNPDNWGFLNTFKEPTLVRYSAKPGFVSNAAFVHFINQNTELKGKYADERFYAFNFYNNDLNSNVLFLQAGAGAGEKYKAYRLGCSSVEVYDIYGNKKATVESVDGTYTFLVDNEPIYVLGSFTEFTEVEAQPTVVSDKVEMASAVGDVVEFEFTKNTDKDLKITVSGAEVVENNGFVENVAQLRVRIPQKTEKMDMISIEDFIPFDVTVSDESGKIYYFKQHRLNATETIEISTQVEASSILNGNRNHLRVTVKNLCNSAAVSGNLDIMEPIYILGEIETKRFENLEAGKSIDFIFNIPEMVIKEAIELEATVRLDTGYVREYEEMHTLCTSVYAEEKPVIDGVVGVTEWSRSSWVGASQEKDIQLEAEWSGADDLSFSTTSMWDEEAFYFLGIVRDDVHMTTSTGPDKLWQADSFQIGIVDGIRRDGFSTSVYTEFTLGHNPDYGDLVYRHKSLLNIPLGIAETAEVVVKRYDKYTVYEAKIPWSEIFEEGYEAKESDEWRFSSIANDQDGYGRYYMEYTGGIGTVKDADVFGKMKMIK